LKGLLGWRRRLGAEIKREGGENSSMPKPRERKRKSK